MNLEFMNLHFRGPVVLTWLRKGLDGPLQGGQLVEILGTPTTLHGKRVPGIVDNVHIADKWLQLLEAEQALVRGPPNPTRELRFFGVGGLNYSQALKTGYHGVLYAWDPGPKFQETIKLLEMP